MIERRKFLAAASGTLATVAAATIADAPNVIAQPKVQWRMSTAWTPALDHLQGVAQRLAKIVEETSGGRFRIEVFPGGQLMPPLDCFEAASRGTIEAFMASAYYGRLVLPGRRTQALGRNVRALQPRPSPGHGGVSADGRMVQEEDQYDR